VRRWQAARPGDPPPRLREPLRAARRVEWISLGFFATAIVAVALAMGSSQAMKTAWVDDLLGVVPPIAVLIADRLCSRRPDRSYPYGLHRCVTIAFLVAAVALLALGLVLVFDGASTLIRGERPTIGGITIAGHQVWLGWAMIAALVWSAAPTVFLGRIKARLARELHDKALHADAEMNRADWMTGLAAMLGVLGIGLGLWWADAVAAIFIALDIVRDGVANLRTVVGDLMDRRPRVLDGSGWDRLLSELERALERLPWVLGAAVRLRECGRLYFGEAYVRPVDGECSLERIHEVQAVARALDWRIHDLTVQFVADELVGAGGQSFD
jgi:cation diffusion facilitator family transporter